MDIPAMPVPNPTRTIERQNEASRDGHQPGTGRDLQRSLPRIHIVAPSLLAPA